MPFLRDEQHRLRYGWWMGPMGKATCEGSHAFDSLQVWMSLPPPDLTRLGDSERFVWYTSSAVCRMTTFASCPSGCVRIRRFSATE